MTSFVSSCKKLFANHLFAANIGLSFGLSGLGDLLEQRFEKKNHLRTGQINWVRTLHMSTAFGLTSGLLCHHWYHYLDRVVPGKGVRVVVQKIVLDQVLFSPVCIAACLLVAGKLERQTTSQLVNQTVQIGGRLYLAEWVIWPPAQFINFYYLPTRFRVLYDNIVSLAYDTYTSHIKHQVTVVENFEEKLIRSGYIPCSEHYRAIVLDYAHLDSEQKSVIKITKVEQHECENEQCL